MTRKLFALLACIWCTSAYAINFQEASPCSPETGGSYCEIYPKEVPTRHYRHVVYCGNSAVYVTERQRQALNAYLRANQNMVLRFSLNDEYIDSPCF